MSGRGSFFLVSNICTFSVSWVNLYLVAWFVCFVVALLLFLSFFRFYVCLLFKIGACFNVVCADPVLASFQVTSGPSVLLNSSLSYELSHNILLDTLTSSFFSRLLVIFN